MKQGLIHNIYSSENAGRLGSESVRWGLIVDRKVNKAGEEEKLVFTHLMLEITRFELGECDHSHCCEQRRMPLMRWSRASTLPETKESSTPWLPGRHEDGVG